MEPVSVVEKAVSLAGSQAALARLVGVKQPYVFKWLKAKRFPPDRVLSVYYALEGLMTPFELSPDIYPDPHWLPPGRDAGACAAQPLRARASSDAA